MLHKYKVKYLIDQFPFAIHDRFPFGKKIIIWIIREIKISFRKWELVQESKMKISLLNNSKLFPFNNLHITILSGSPKNWITPTERIHSTSDCLVTLIRRKFSPGNNFTCIFYIPFRKIEDIFPLRYYFHSILFIKGKTQHLRPI